MAQTKIQFTAVFNRKDTLNNKGEALVQIEAYLNRQRKYFRTGIYLKPVEWNEATRTVTRKRTNHVTVNNDIAKLIEGLKTHEYALSMEQPEYNLDDLKKRFEKPAIPNFTDFAKAQVEGQRKSLSPATIDKQLRHIEKFKEFAGKEIKFSDLNFALIENFKNFLFNEDKDVNTVHDYFKRLGKFANMAIEHGYLKENIFQKIKPSRVQKVRQVITDTELKQIEKLKFTKAEKHLERTRDLFLIQCYTGLRFSDASVLSRKHIYETKSEGMELRMTSKKERKDVKLPLRYLFPVPGQKLSKPEQLIKKYWRENDSPLFIPDRYNDLKDIKRLENEASANLQVTNRQLKDIQKKAKVKTLLTNHVGRHSFATFLLDRIPVTIIQELLQHSKIETTMIYTHVSNERVKKNLREIKDWG